MERINKKYIKACIFARLIWFVIIAAAFAVCMCLHINYMNSNDSNVSLLVLWAVPFGAIVLFFAFYAFLFPILEYKVFRYEITDDRVNIIKGVIFRKNCVVPIVRLQHASVSAGPINRLLNLAVLNINTAGAFENIVGLDATLAQGLCDQLKNKLDARLADKTGEQYDDKEI